MAGRDSLDYLDLPLELRGEIASFLEEGSRFSLSLVDSWHRKHFPHPSPPNFGSIRVLVDCARNGYRTFLAWLFASFGYSVAPRVLFPKILIAALERGHIDIVEWLLPKTPPPLYSTTILELYFAAGAFGDEAIFARFLEILSTAQGRHSVQGEMKEYYCGACSAGRTNILRDRKELIGEEWVLHKVWTVGCKANRNDSLETLLELFPKFFQGEKGVHFFTLTFPMKDPSIRDRLLKVDFPIRPETYHRALECGCEKGFLDALFARLTAPLPYPRATVQYAATGASLEVFKGLYESYDMASEYSTLIEFAVTGDNVDVLRLLLKDRKLERPRLTMLISRCLREDRLKCLKVLLPLVEGEPHYGVFEYSKNIGAMMDYLDGLNTQNYSLQKSLGVQFVRAGELARLQAGREKYVSHWASDLFEIAFREGQISTMIYLAKWVDTKSLNPSMKFFHWFDSVRSLELATFFRLMIIRCPNFAGQIRAGIHLASPACMDYLSQRRFLVFDGGLYRDLYKSHLNVVAKSPSERVVLLVEWLVQNQIRLPEDRLFQEKFVTWFHKVFSSWFSQQHARQAKLIPALRALGSFEPEVTKSD